MHIEKDVLMFREYAQRDIDHYEMVIKENQAKVDSLPTFDVNRQLPRFMVNTYKAKKEAVNSLMEVFEDLFSEYAPVEIEQKEAVNE